MIHTIRVEGVPFSTLSFFYSVAGGLFFNAYRITSGDLNSYDVMYPLFTGSEKVANKPCDWVYIITLKTKSAADKVQIGIPINVNKVFIRNTSNIGTKWSEWRFINY